MGRYFGTDGIRGIYGDTLTDQLAYKIGNAIATLKPKVKVVLGRDTRVSGKSLAISLSKGIIDGGGNVIDAGIIPTPTIAFVTIDSQSDYGIVISASHNPPEYNGIKVFNSKGRKLPDKDQIKIEESLDSDYIFMDPNPGEVVNSKDYSLKYIDAVCKSIDITFEGLSVGLDCADGAACTVASKIFKKLGAEVMSYNDEGDGRVINYNKGALHPSFIANHVVHHKYDLGFAFDGDADRLIAVDSEGNTIDGDKILYAIGNYLKKRNKLNNNTVVGTLHTNMAVELALKEKGINLIRTAIGDQYVAQEMIKNDYIVGGEQSGHIILRNFLDTGDGIYAAAYLMKLMVEEEQNIKELVDVKLMPQVNVGVIVKDNKAVIKDPRFIEACKRAEAELEGKGRLLIRASGTEPKIRIMAESNDLSLAKDIAKRLEIMLKGEF